jgi:hypothetical protein
MTDANGAIEGNDGASRVASASRKLRGIAAFSSAISERAYGQRP